jgi:O-phosphoseryl-tRNA(Cys) synthetase
MVYTFLVKYSLSGGVNVDDFKKSVQKVIDNFYVKQEGFISFNFGYDEKENKFFEVHTWKDKSFTEAAHPKFMIDEDCLAVFGMCEMGTMGMVDLNLISNK